MVKVPLLGDPILKFAFGIVNNCRVSPVRVVRRLGTPKLPFQLFKEMKRIRVLPLAQLTFGLTIVNGPNTKFKDDSGNRQPKLVPLSSRRGRCLTCLTIFGSTPRCGFAYF